MTMTRKDLCNALEHLAFEVHHFQCFSKLYKNRKLARMCPAATQAVHYALLIHMRLLLEFFFIKPKRDDVSVMHFADAIDPGVVSASQAQWEEAELKELRSQLNRKLAHFSKDRWIGQRTPMDFYMQYASRLDRQIEVFIDALPADMRERYERGLRRWAFNAAIVR